MGRWGSIDRAQTTNAPVCSCDQAPARRRQKFGAKMKFSVSIPTLRPRILSQAIPCINGGFYILVPQSAHDKVPYHMIRYLITFSCIARRDRAPLPVLQFRTILVQGPRGHHSAALCRLRWGYRVLSRDGGVWLLRVLCVARSSSPESSRFSPQSIDSGAKKGKNTVFL